MIYASPAGIVNFFFFNVQNPSQQRRVERLRLISKGVGVLLDLDFLPGSDVSMWNNGACLCRALFCLPPWSWKHLGQMHNTKARLLLLSPEQAPILFPSCLFPIGTPAGFLMHLFMTTVYSGFKGKTSPQLFQLFNGVSVYS